MQKKLDEFTIGETGHVVKVLGEGRLRRRLFDMGVTPGAKILMTKKAPLGDPIQIDIRSYELTLRKTEANLIVMEVE